jgi:hypothetical protein
MGVFTFIIILVLISTLGKAALAIAGPLGDHLGELLREMSAERKARREAIESGVRLDSVVVEELETRLDRIEQRLDFIEELRAPEQPASLPRGAPRPGD